MKEHRIPGALANIVFESVKEQNGENGLRMLDKLAKGDVLILQVVFKEWN